MENFRDIAAILIESGGGFQIADESELFELVRNWLAAPAMCREQGEKAQTAMQPHQGAVGRNLKLIRSLLETWRR
jgi:3-deoxy-D-manno-octulosonic-acid transferase